MEYGEQSATMAGMKEMQQLSATSLDLDNQVIKCTHHLLKQDSNRGSYKKPPRIIIAPTCYVMPYI